jgi:hypothetical protein
MIRRILITLIFAFAVTSCEMFSSGSEILMQSSEISLTWKNTPQIVYEEGECQLGFNNERNEYRVYNDKLAYWFTVRCSEKPVSVGQVITAYVSWTGKTASKAYTGLEFLVKKTNEEGMVWLWNESESIGIIIKNII